MHPRPRMTPTLLVLSAVLVLLASWAIDTSQAQGQVQVTAADPAATEQGTANLNVKVTGKGFKNGARAQWFVTGTTNPGGVTVNSTSFVSSTELTANITVSDTALISNFDIQVLNSDGRGGKGTELFAVTAKGNASNLCTAQPLPTGISLVSTLNYVTQSGGAAYGPALGISVRARQMILNSAPVLVVAVGTPADTGKLEIFFLDPINGNVLDGTIIGTGSAPQPHITVNYRAGARSLAVGDVDANGIPDFVAGSSTTNAANAVVGSLAGGVVSYQNYPLTMPSTATNVGWGVAMGDLNGNGNDIVAVGATGGGTGLFQPGQVSLFSFTGSGFQNTLNIVSPLGNKKNPDSFGSSVAIADVTGSPSKDLIVGGPSATVNGNTGAGLAYVFPGPVNASNYLTASTGVKSDGFARKVGAGLVNGDSVSDMLATTTTGALVYNGQVTSGVSPSFSLQPASGLGSGWATTEPDISDVNGDGLGDVIVGAPNAASGSTCGGITYLYLSYLGSPLATRLPVSSPVYDAQSVQRFGWAAVLAPGTKLFFVGDNGLNIGSTSPGGQVYVFRVN